MALIFPPECEVCRAVSSSPACAALCERCEASIRWIQPPFCAFCGRGTAGAGRCGQCADENFHFDRVFACAYYEGPMKTLLHAYKFGGRKSLAAYFSDRLLRLIEAQALDQRLDAVVSVPMDKGKEKARGFNQSRLIASRLARRLGVPDLTGHLKRNTYNAPQALLDKKGRLVNVRGSFSAVSAAAFENKTVLLVDDIITTGQTVSECACALKDAGAASVTALACARGV